MKKLVFVFLCLFAFNGFASAQKILPFKPSLSIVIKGGISVPVSGGTYTSLRTPVTYEGGSFKDYFGAFLGAQLDASVNLTPSFGIFGNFSADFLSPKEARVGLTGATYTQSNSTQFSGSIGPRVYVNLPGNIFSKFYTEAGFGIYSLKYGDEKITYATSGGVSDNFSYSAASQLGFNIGAGFNVSASPKSFVNISIKYHNILKKSDVTFSEKWTHTAGGQDDLIILNTAYDLASRSYIQISAGFGFNLGF